MKVTGSGKVLPDHGSEHIQNALQISVIDAKAQEDLLDLKYALVRAN